MWLSGKSKKNVFELDVGSLKLKFHQKITENLGKLIFKALEVLIMTQMRQETINKKVGIFTEDLFCVIKFCRICVIIKTSGALKMNQPKMSVIFW